MNMKVSLITLSKRLPWTSHLTDHPVILYYFVLFCVCHFSLCEINYCTYIFIPCLSWLEWERHEGKNFGLSYSGEEWSLSESGERKEGDEGGSSWSGWSVSAVYLIKFSSLWTLFLIMSIRINKRLSVYLLISQETQKEKKEPWN